MLRIEAPAKINLGLRVLRRRADGYHDVETVLYRIAWADALEASLADRLSLTCSDATLPVDARNLCLKAALLLRETYGVARGAALHLDKRVPYGAGLGGGSSDAATTLRVLAGLWELDASAGALEALAARLGADVPFFLGDEAAHATGRGDRLEPLVDAATGQTYNLPFYFVVVVPPVLVSTAEAYRLVVPRDDRAQDLREIVWSNDLERWRTALVNDFEKPICRRHPEIGRALELLRENGAGYAAMSGSGSAAFGVFEEARKAHEAAEAGRRREYRVFIQHTV